VRVSKTTKDATAATATNMAIKWKKTKRKASKQTTTKHARILTLRSIKDSVAFSYFRPDNVASSIVNVVDQTVFGQTASGVE